MTPPHEASGGSAHAPDGGVHSRSVPVAILTVSDTRTPETDTSGRAILELLASAGHSASPPVILPDDPERIAALISEWAARADLSAIVTSGGTGISGRDRTFEAISTLFERRLEGFGELFRHLSFEQVGSQAMLSRAASGVVSNKIVFILPGSENAVRLAMTRLILPELRHIVSELERRD